MLTMAKPIQSLADSTNHQPPNTYVEDRREFRDRAPASCVIRTGRFFIIRVSRSRIPMARGRGREARPRI